MSPKSSEQFELQREESKARILAAALELFAKKGFGSTSIAAIAQRANVSKGLMYNYFESKDDLLKGVIIHAVSDGSEIFLDAMRKETALQKLEAMIDASFLYMKTKKEYYRLVTTLALQEEPIEFIQQIAKSKEKEFGPVLENLLSELGFNNLKEEVMIFSALMDGVATKYLILSDDKYLDEMMSLMKKRYCQQLNK